MRSLQAWETQIILTNIFCFYFLTACKVPENVAHCLRLNYRDFFCSFLLSQISSQKHRIAQLRILQEKVGQLLDNHNARGHRGNRRSVFKCQKYIYFFLRNFIPSLYNYLVLYFKYVVKKRIPAASVYFWL